MHLSNFHILRKSTIPVILVIALHSYSFSQSMKNQGTKFESLSPNLVVPDVNNTIEFYTNLLRFTFIAAKPESGVHEWGMVMKGSVTIMFQTFKSLKQDLPQIEPSSGVFGTLFIKVTDVEGYFTQVRNGVKVVSALKVTPYGMKEFTIQDVNGYYLTFAEPIQ